MSNEARNIRLLVAFIFLNVSITVAIGIYVSTLFLAHYPSAWLPYFYIGQVVALLSLLYGTQRYSSRYPKQAAMWLYIVTCIVILAAGSLLYWNIPGVPFIFSIIFAPLGSISTINCWNFPSLVLGIRGFKAHNPKLMMASTLSAIVAGITLPFLISVAGFEILLVVCTMLLIASVINLYYLEVPILQELPKKYPAKIRHNKLFVSILILVILTYVVFTLIDYNLKTALAAQFTSDRIAQFLSSILVISNLIGLLIQTTIAKKIIQYYGVSGLVASLPIAILIFAISYLIMPGLVTAVLLSIGYSIMNYSLYVTGREMSLNILPSMLRIKAKSIIKGIGNTIGTIVGSGLVIIVVHYFNSYEFSILLILLSMMMLIIAIRLQKLYIEELTQALTLRWFKPELIFENLIDEKYYQKLVYTTLSSNDVQTNILGLSFIHKAGFSSLPKELIKFFYSKNKNIKIMAIKALQNINDYKIEKLILELIKFESDAEIINNLLYVLSRINPKKSRDIAIYYLNQDSLTVHEAAINILIKQGSLKDIDIAINKLINLINSDDIFLKASAANIIANVSIGDLSSDIINLIKDSDFNVSKNALRAAKRMYSLELLAVAANKLQDSKLAYYAIQAIKPYNESAIPILKHQLDIAKTINHKVAVIKALAFLESNKVIPELIKIYGVSNFVIKNKIAKYLMYRFRDIEKPKELISFSLDQLIIEANYIQLLNSLSVSDDFALKEVLARRNLTVKRALYWLAIANHVKQILPIIPIVIENFGKKTIVLDQALELLEEEIIYKEQVPLIRTIFDMANPGNPKLALQISLPRLDDWLKHCLQTPCIMIEGKPMDTFQKMIVLRNIEIFSDLAGETLLAIAEESRERDVAKGEIIYKEHDSSEYLYMVVSGEVDLLHQQQLITHYTKNDFFGLIALLDNTPYAATAQATSSGVLLYLDKVTLNRIMDDLPEVVIAINQVLIRYLKRVMAKTPLKLF